MGVLVLVALFWAASQGEYLAYAQTIEEQQLQSIQGMEKDMDLVMKIVFTTFSVGFIGKVFHSFNKNR